MLFDVKVLSTIAKIMSRINGSFLHFLDYEKQGFCAYIPLFGGGIEDFVCINLDLYKTGVLCLHPTF